MAARPCRTVSSTSRRLVEQLRRAVSRADPPPARPVPPSKHAARPCSEPVQRRRGEATAIRRCTCDDDAAREGTISLDALFETTADTPTRRPDVAARIHVTRVHRSGCRAVQPPRASDGSNQIGRRLIVAAAMGLSRNREVPAPAAAGRKEAAIRWRRAVVDRIARAASDEQRRPGDGGRPS